MSDQRDVTALPLTKRQERAMLAFLYRYNESGFTDECSDGDVWDWGVRPWPTMENLAAKGLVTEGDWFGPDAGRLWNLTDAGRSYMETVVLGRAESITGAAR